MSERSRTLGVFNIFNERSLKVGTSRRMNRLLGNRVNIGDEGAKLAIHRYTVKSMFYPWLNSRLLADEAAGVPINAFGLGYSGKCRKNTWVGTWVVKSLCSTPVAANKRGVVLLGL